MVASLLDWIRGHRDVREHEGRRLIKRSEFVWHQRFELVPSVFTPGRNDIDWLLSLSGVPDDLTGKTVLDVGTFNGGAAFTLERRGADRVVAADVVGPEKFGFATLRDFLESRVEFVQSNIYELPAVLRGETFDVVLFWGVLYHLRHPLIGLDAVRAVTKGEAWIETQVADGELGEGISDLSVARFYRKDLYGDHSNWFAPTIRTLVDWCMSSGLTPIALEMWPVQRHHRAMIGVVRTAGEPEYRAWEPPESGRAALTRFSSWPDET